MTIPLENTGARNSLRAAKPPRANRTAIKQVQQNVLITIDNDIATATHGSSKWMPLARRGFTRGGASAPNKRNWRAAKAPALCLQITKDLTAARSADQRGWRIQ